MAQLSVGSAITTATALLEAAGVSTQRAEVTARAIVASDRWGIGSHGLMRLPFYLARLQAGGINSKAELKIQRQSLRSLQIYQALSSLMAMMVLGIGSYTMPHKLL